MRQKKAALFKNLARLASSENWSQHCARQQQQQMEEKLCWKEFHPSAQLFRHLLQMPSMVPALMTCGCQSSTGRLAWKPLEFAMSSAAAANGGEAALEGIPPPRIDSPPFAAAAEHGTGSNGLKATLPGPCGSRKWRSHIGGKCLAVGLEGSPAQYRGPKCCFMPFQELRHTLRLLEWYLYYYSFTTGTTFKLSTCVCSSLYPLETLLRQRAWNLLPPTPSATHHHMHLFPLLMGPPPLPDRRAVFWAVRAPIRMIVGL